jgi:hypothetical protein
MKKFLLFISFFGFLNAGLKSQTIVGIQNFDSIINWTISPSGSWTANTVYKVSNPKSFHGVVPNQLGDSMMLTTPFFDCTQYAFVWLSFTHICKIASNDIAQIEMQEIYRVHNGKKFRQVVI